MLDLPIFHKTYAFIILFSGYVGKFPKHDRFTLGARIENTSLELLMLIMRANYGQSTRLNFLNEGSITLDMLKILVRIAKDKKAIHPNQYLILEERLQEIGRMLGGWIKSSSAKRPV
jgi:hypothetical protein